MNAFIKVICGGALQSGSPSLIANFQEAQLVAAV